MEEYSTNFYFNKFVNRLHTRLLSTASSESVSLLLWTLSRGVLAYETASKTRLAGGQALTAKRQIQGEQLQGNNK